MRIGRKVRDKMFTIVRANIHPAFCVVKVECPSGHGVLIQGGPARITVISLCVDSVITGTFFWDKEEVSMQFENASSPELLEAIHSHLAMYQRLWKLAA